MLLSVCLFRAEPPRHTLEMQNPAGSPGVPRTSAWEPGHVYIEKLCAHRVPEELVKVQIRVESLHFLQAPSRRAELPVLGRVFAWQGAGFPNLTQGWASWPWSAGSLFRLLSIWRATVYRGHPAERPKGSRRGWALESDLAASFKAEGHADGAAYPTEVPGPALRKAGWT